LTAASALHGYLRQAARDVPGRPAVRFRSDELNYEQLYRAASGLAQTLADGGIERGERVAIWLPKGIEAIVSIHATLMSGAAYVPIDPASPVARAVHILRDCQVASVITTQEHFELASAEMAALPHVRLLIVTGDERESPEETDGPQIVSWASAIAVDAGMGRQRPEDPHQLAYVLYTSGSSGTPKGVMLSHLNGDVLVQWACRRFGFTEHDRIASHAPLHFDLSIIDVFCAACAGATLVLVPDNQRVVAAALVRFIVTERITVWYSVPGALVALLDASNTDLLDEAVLRLVLYAGEPFPLRRLRELVARLPSAQIHNLYGPTETNVCTAHRVNAQDVADEAVGDVPIGQLCDFAIGHVIDDAGATAALTPGIRGELVIGGASVMLGYWGAGAENGMSPAGAPDSALISERVHRTGDLVHVNSHGDLVFEGRRDDMVKIRGYRVEPAEVETAILASEDIREACVVAVADGAGTSRLEAFVVADRGGDVDITTVQKICSERLPRYMRPHRISCISELPRGSTGKVDRRALIARSQQSESVGGHNT
jgi:amino acid adenylation domain-containing protein